MTVAECAAFLRVSEQTVRMLARRGELPGRKIGKGWRFSQEALLEWLNAYRTEAPGKDPKPTGRTRPRKPAGG